MLIRCVASKKHPRKELVKIQLKTLCSSTVIRAVTRSARYRRFTAIRTRGRKRPEGNYAKSPVASKPSRTKSSSNGRRTKGCSWIEMRRLLENLKELVAQQRGVQLRWSNRWTTASSFGCPFFLLCAHNDSLRKRRNLMYFFFKWFSVFKLSAISNLVGS